MDTPHYYVCGLPVDSHLRSGRPLLYLHRNPISVMRRTHHPPHSFPSPTPWGGRQPTHTRSGPPTPTTHHPSLPFHCTAGFRDIKRCRLSAPLFDDCSCGARPIVRQNHRGWPKKEEEEGKSARRTAVRCKQTQQSSLPLRLPGATSLASSTSSPPRSTLARCYAD